MVERPLWTLPISDSIVRKLKDAGYEYLKDISNEENKKEMKHIAPELGRLTETNLPTLQTAFDLYKVEIMQNGKIVTFSKAFDDLLEGGIPTSRITELVGAPGCGKTQICLQLCVSVQIPKFLGCFSGTAIYVETNSNFSIKRIREIHAASVKHCLKITNSEDLSSQEKLTLHKFISDDPLKNIKRFSVLTIDEFKATVLLIRKVLEENKNVKLIIIDSFTFPFYSIESNFERTRVISELINRFNQLAMEYRVAVVVTNELTTFIQENDAKEIIPSLGETFAHVIHNRILLGRKKSSQYFTALLQKSSEFPCISAHFQITCDGVRDTTSD